LPVSALAATVIGEARKTWDSLCPIRPGKFRFVALMHFMVNSTTESDPPVRRDRQAATGVLSPLHTGAHQNFRRQFPVPARRLQVMDNLRSSRNADVSDRDTLSSQHTRKFEKVARLAAVHEPDVTPPVESGCARVLWRACVGQGLDGKPPSFKLGQIDSGSRNEFFRPCRARSAVRIFGPVELATVIDVGLGLAIKLENTILFRGLDGHVSNSHAIIHRQIGDTLSVELHRAISRAIETDFADAMENDVLGHNTRLQTAFELKMHRFWDFEQQFAGAEYKSASVLPMPVANSLKAPAMQVCESVPKRISPGRVCPFAGRAV